MRAAAWLAFRSFKKDHVLTPAEERGVERFIVFLEGAGYSITRESK